MASSYLQFKYNKIEQNFYTKKLGFKVETVQLIRCFLILITVEIT